MKTNIPPIQHVSDTAFWVAAHRATETERPDALFKDPYARLLSYVWGYFGASLGWLLSHWLLFYRDLAQPTLLLSTLGYGMAVLYYLDHTDRLSKGVRRQFIFIMIAIVLVVLTFSDWGDKVV